MNKRYTSGIWLVKKGNEAAFIALWKEFAQWTSKNQPGATSAILTQDSTNPSRFISFGPWKDETFIQKWREQPKFGEFIQKARVLCESIQPAILKPVAQVGLP